MTEITPQGRKEDAKVFPNLARELKNKGITYRAVAGLIGCTEKSVQNKMSGVTDFTLSEVLLINENMFPEYELKYLFKKGA